MINYFNSDHESITGFPLEGSEHAAVDYYQNFLRQTNRYLNPWSSGNLTLLLKNSIRNNRNYFLKIEKYVKVLHPSMNLKIQTSYMFSIWKK